MDTKIAVVVFALLILLSAHGADAQQPAASRGSTLQSPEVRSTQECDDAFHAATNSGVQAFIQRDHPSIGNERKRITGLALDNRLKASCLTEQPVSTYIAVAKSVYPIETVGVIARSVTFPSVLNQGQWIIDTKYPNASIFCLDVAFYSGLVTGLIWSMDRDLVEEHDLQHLIDRARTLTFTCVGMFIPVELLNKRVEQQMGQGLPEEHATAQKTIEVQLARLDSVAAALPEIEENTPAVSMEDAKKAVVAQIEFIQVIIRFAQTVESKQND